MSCLPDEGQLLLLDAALGTGDRAAASWAEWEHRYRLDRPDEGSYRLLPQVYRNLSSQGLDGPERLGDPPQPQQRGVLRDGVLHQLMPAAVHAAATSPAHSLSAVTAPSLTTVVAMLSVVTQIGVV